MFLRKMDFSILKRCLNEYESKLKDSFIPTFIKPLDILNGIFN